MEIFREFLESLKKAIEALTGKGFRSAPEAEGMKAYYDELAGIYKNAVSGTFEKINEAANSTGDAAENEKAPAGERVQRSIKKATTGERYVQIDENAIDLNNGKSIAQNIAEILHNKFNNLIIANGQYIRVNSDTNREFRSSKWANRLYSANREWYNDKIKSLANADEILIVAKNWVNENIKHERKDDITSFGRGNILYKVGENGYTADVLVGVKDDGSAVLYDIIDISNKKIEEAVDTVENKILSSGDNNSSVGNNTTTLSESQGKVQNSRKTGRSAVYYAYEIMDMFGIKKDAKNRDSIANTLEQMLNSVRADGEYMNDDFMRLMAEKAAELILPDVKRRRSDRANGMLREIRGGVTQTVDENGVKKNRRRVI